MNFLNYIFKDELLKIQRFLYKIRWKREARKNSKRCFNEDAVRRWEQLGLLDGLEGEQKEECAVCCEKMATYILSEYYEPIEKPPYYVLKDGVNYDKSIESGIFQKIRDTFRNRGGFHGKFQPKQLMADTVIKSENQKQENK